ncbi:S-adenosylmethionine:tRNA ribosyltransferase-isomerase [Runella slithyformis]|uniref:S-adenosylmethionine:tRNA ribosyltransferase-isomerase n=1 Tax=Runella slithyformis (strain ATCC 29530 / DSM 19594 / LMG 11500 / NCIMB 11436 / LSU 4) TaxID=761193 RepID=A0A7U4E862_RUNSL|nr:S-adenosylmethionine:tRNA ribosyltransferase-isomerase [Runella slithyformis]AEI50924.1 S-adenosylmethionine:tRNAribosyltransferase-isom erase [Runella slithyformis DSM 19594]
MQNLPEIPLADYQYDLPDERIARFPVEPRDTSKLLIYENGTIKHDRFYALPEHLPNNAFLVFNDTKVIPARVFFYKSSGAMIEVFLLHPEMPSRIINDVMQQTHFCVWSCMVGNKKRWKAGEVLTTELRINNYELRINAEWADVENNWVKFSWESTSGTSYPFQPPSFAEVIRALGEIPLPPYLGRSADAHDADTYQTVYSKVEGAVAAPTAGLHFTDGVFRKLTEKGIRHDFVTLHVGAGTFQPVKVLNAVEHTMHSEQVVFKRSLVQHLLENLPDIVAVGTTSMRSLESLYWIGTKLLMSSLKQRTDGEHFFIEKLMPYQAYNSLPTAKESLEAVLKYMSAYPLDELVGETEIMIFPGYEFKICQGLITNYHQPGSTLMLLVAAFIGPQWRTVYQVALDSDYRFLSYGDSSLLWRADGVFN